MRELKAIRNIRLGIKTLMLHKLRSLLTVLGVVFGVGSVIAMLAVGEGASEQAMREIRKLGSNNIILSALKPTEDEQTSSGQSLMSIYGLLYEDEARIRQTIPGVQRTVPVKQVRKEGRLGERALELRVMGTTADWFDLVKRPLLAGRILRNADIADNASVCVLTEAGARRLLATEHSIGQTLRIGTDSYIVVGIVGTEESGGNIQTPDQQTDAYIPLSVAKERHGDMSIRRSSGSIEAENVELHMIIVEAGQRENVERISSAIETMLKRFHKKTDYHISVPLALLRQAEATKRTFNIVLGSIAGISLVVGGIGIMNIMLASVTERTREIGIRRAIGAKRRQIISQFLIETIVLSTIGGLLGIALGLLFPWLITRFSNMPTIVPAYGIALSVCISVAVGVIFGLYPAVRAAKLDPIVALRHE
ncbi:MAG: FtsX-like permease family protein [Planctomycetes bacterium]|jgi:putative ABC transport system permease protein|nr:FtsX-like permease family protein [Planctomycetota bacterium]